MARIIDQRFDTAAGAEGVDSGDKTLIYLLDQCTNEDDAVQEVANEAPLSLTLPLGRIVGRQGFEWEPMEADGCYTVTVLYGDLKELEEDGEAADWSFDTTGGTGRMTQSIQTKGRYGRPGDVLSPPDFKGAIGVTDDGVEGCDVPIRTFKWTETHDLPRSLVQFTAYSDVLAELTGTKNASGFRGKPAHAVLFHGAQGSPKDSETARVTFHFESGKHVTGGTFGPFTGVDKEAWDYIWYRFREVEDTEAKKTVKRAIACYVEEVVPAANWSVMGIGS